MTLLLVLPVGAVDDVVPLDTVDAEFRAKETVRGTIRPLEERESFRMELPRGAKLKGSAKALGASSPPVSLDALDPESAVFLQVVGGRGTTKLPRITIDQSGSYVVRATGDHEHDGDYQLKLSVKMPKRWRGTSPAALAPGAEEAHGFAAAAGSRASISIAAGSRSDCRPVVLRVEGPEAFLLTPVPPPTPGKKHVLGDVTLPATGEYRVILRNDGVAEGTWKATIKLRPPRAVRTKLDITDDALAGEFAGEQAVVARTVDADGGEVAATLGDDDLVGVVLTVPAGAVTAPVLITLSQSDDFFVDDDTHAAGTTVQFGPAGLEFATDASVTVPFDAQGFDPGDDVLVAIEDGDTGEIVIVTGTVNADQTVTFPTSHFSRFQAVSRRPRPLVGGFVELELSGELLSANAGSVSMGLHSIVGAKGPRTGNGVARSVDRMSIGWAPALVGDQSFQLTTEARTQPGTAIADEQLTLDVGGQNLVYDRGRSNDVLLRRGATGDQAGVTVLLRRVKGAPSKGALRGDWHAFVVEYAAASAKGEPLRLLSAGQTFDLTVEPLGRATASGARLVATRADYPGGTPLTTVVRRAPAPGTLRPAGNFARLEMAIGAEADLTSIDLHPVVRGDALVGLARRLEGDPKAPDRAVMRLVILVRAGQSGDEAILDGRSVFGAFGFGLTPGVDGGPSVDVALELLELDVLHDGLRDVRAIGTATKQEHAKGGATAKFGGTENASGRYHVDRDLGYDEDATGRRGAVLRRGGLFVDSAFDGFGVSIGFGVPARPLPE